MEQDQMKEKAKKTGENVRQSSMSLRSLFPRAM